MLILLLGDPEATLLCKTLWALKNPKSRSHRSPPFRNLHRDPLFQHRPHRRRHLLQTRPWRDPLFHRPNRRRHLLQTRPWRDPLFQHRPHRRRHLLQTRPWRDPLFQHGPHRRRHLLQTRPWRDPLFQHGHHRTKMNFQGDVVPVYLAGIVQVSCR